LIVVDHASGVSTDAFGVSAVFGPVSSVDFVVDVVASVNEGDVFLDAAGPDPTFVLLLDATEPGRVERMSRGSGRG